MSFNNETKSKKETGFIVVEGKEILHRENEKIIERGPIVYSKETQLSTQSDSINLDLTTNGDEKNIADAHTHPYSKEEGGYQGVAFSVEDIQNLRYYFLTNKVDEGYTRIVEAGNTRYALVITDKEKALEFFKKNKNSVMKENYFLTRINSSGSFQDKIIKSVKATLGSDSGIGFYKSFDTEKKLFEKLN